jgi:hypothetical protein
MEVIAGRDVTDYITFSVVTDSKTGRFLLGHKRGGRAWAATRSPFFNGQ